jgi:outer membrane protein assembly factor BamD
MTQIKAEGTMKNSKTALVIASLVIVAMTMHVSAAKPKKLFDCTGKIQKAIEKYNKKKYLDCQDILTEVLTQCPGHSAYDTALYYQAKSMLATKKYEEAKTEFDRLASTYPNSPFYEEAFFRIGQCMSLESNAPDLDQATTKDAQGRLKDFCESFSKSVYVDSARILIARTEDKLAEKELLNARFYEKIDQFDAAVVYYKLMIQEFPQSKLVPDAMLAMAEDLIKANRMGEAAVVLDDVSSRSNDDAVLKKARSMKSKLSK